MKCDCNTLPEPEICDRCKDIKKEQDESKSASVTGLDGIAEKFKKYFCMSNSCSDSDNKQHPDCQIEHCLYRDRIVEDLMKIIKDAI